MNYIQKSSGDFNLKTTKKHFDLFRKEGSYWLVRLNLRDYDFIFVHVDLEDRNARAWVDISLDGKVVTFGLAEDWGWMEPDDYLIAKSAFHECCEVMLYKLHHHLTNFYSYKFVDEMRHEVIRTLEHTMFEDYWVSKIKTKKGKK